MSKIYTGETPMQELTALLMEETRMMGQKIALELGCEPEDLAFSVANDGTVAVHQMTPEERIEREAQETKQKRVIAIKKKRGVLDA